MRFGRSIEAEEFLEEGKLEFRDAKSSSVSSPGQTGGQWGEDEGRKPEKTSICGGVEGKRERESTMERERKERGTQGIFTAIFSTTYPQIPCLNL